MFHVLATLALLAGAASPPAAPRASMGPFVIFFDEGSARLQPMGRPILDHLVQAMRLYPATRVIADGYDAIGGTTANNHAIACARARNARRYLIAHGVSARRLSIRAPTLVPQLESGAPELGRRVEFSFVRPADLVEARTRAHRC